MFSLNLEIQASKKKTFTLKGNQYLVNGLESRDLNAREANVVIEEIWKEVDKEWRKAIPSINKSDFDTVFQAVTYLKDITHTCIEIKGINCYRGKTLDDYTEAILSKRNELWRKVIHNRFNSFEKFVLYKVTHTNFHSHGGFGSYNTWSYGIIGEEYEDIYRYDPVTMSVQKCEEALKAFESFDWGKYNLNKDSLVSKLKSKYEYYLETIKGFEHIVEQAGNDLPNWSDVKVTRRLRSGGFEKLSNSDVSKFIEERSKHLMRTGKAIDPKKKKKSKAQKLKIEFKKNPEGVSQKDLISLYKTCPVMDRKEVSRHMEADTIFSLFDSKLKTVKKLIEDEGSLLFGLVTSELEKLNPKQLLKWEELLVTNKYRIQSSDVNSIQKLFFDLSTDTLLYLVKSPHTHFEINLVERMKKEESPFEKYFITSRMSATYLDSLEKSDFENAVKKMCELSKIHPSVDDFNTLLDNKLPKKEDKEKLFWDNPSLMFSYTDALASLGNEKLAVEFYLKRHKSHTNSKLLNLLSSDSIRKVQAEKDFNKFDADYDDVNEDTLTLFLEDYPVSSDIWESALGSLITVNKARANKYLQTLKDGCKVCASMVSKLDANTKHHLISLGSEVKERYYYTRDNKGWNESRMEESFVSFYKDLRRDQVLEIFGDDFYLGRKNMFLAHVMTREELVEAAERNRYFLRHHLDKFQYGYLKKYSEDKELFKRVVGDRRNTSNRNFGEALLKKMKVNHSVDFMFGD